jgi:hypothetical protein
MEINEVIRWEVFLDDNRLTSNQITWEEVPSRVIALKIWYPKRKMLLWGLSHYGRPDTLKDGIDIPDNDFDRILDEAKRSK